jgi:hypothetical protein
MTTTTVTPCDLVCDYCGRTLYWCKGHPAPTFSYVAFDGVNTITREGLDKATLDRHVANLEACFYRVTVTEAVS